MNPDTIDADYAALAQQGQQTAQLVQTLAGKLQAAAAAGDANAREWQPDLRELAPAIREEEAHTSNLLQSIHSMIDTHVQASPPASAYDQPAFTAQPQYQQPGTVMSAGAPGAGGGMLQRFLGGGFDRAVATGAGFGIGDELIQSIF